MHARAWLDPIFQNEYRVAPHPSCPACHAPLAPANADRVADDARAGIACAVCHVRARTVFAADRAGRKKQDANAAAFAHPTETLPLLAASEFCAPCHQFHFPAGPDDAGGTAYDSTLWLQDTYNEWTRSLAAASGVQCQDCHMPMVQNASGRTHRSHRFAGMRSRDLVTRALQVTSDVRIDGEYIVLRLHLKGADIGHSLPTGDMFRQLVVRAWLDGHPDNEAEEVLRRWFAPVRRVTAGGTVAYVHGERADTRVPPPGDGRARTVELRLPAPNLASDRSAQAPTTAISWRITLWAREPRSVLLRDVPGELARTVVRKGRVPLSH